MSTGQSNIVAFPKPKILTVAEMEADILRQLDLGRAVQLGSLLIRLEERSDAEGPNLVWRRAAAAR